jgi:hypothetical protein
MRSLFYYSGRGWTGEARAFAIAARGLAARGEPVTVVCRPDGDAELGFAREELDVVTIPVTDSVTRDAWRLRAVLKEKFTEVVFLHTEREQLVASSAMRLAARGAIVRRIPTGCAVGAGRGARLASRLASVRLHFSTEEERARAGAESDGYVAPLGVDLERLDAERAASRSTLGVEPGTKLMVCVADKRARSRITTALRTVGLLAERHPGLRISVDHMHPEEAIELLRAGKLEVAIIFRYDETEPEPAGVRLHHLLDDPVYVLSTRRERGLASLRDATWIAGCERCRSHLLSMCADAGFDPRIGYSSDDMVVMSAWVAAGLGVATQTGLALRAHHVDGIVATELPGCERRIYAATYGEPPDPPATAALLEALAEAAVTTAAP